MTQNIRLRLIATGLYSVLPTGALAAGLYPLATLQAQVERFAGQPALIDPRLLLPDCARTDFNWAAERRSVRVHCPAPEWVAYINVETLSPPVLADDANQARGVPAPAPAPTLALPASASRPAIRRGDRVMVEAGGDGFVIGMEAIAETDSRDGRVALRGAGSGKRLMGLLQPDGRVTLAGLSTMVNGR